MKSTVLVLGGTRFIGRTFVEQISLLKNFEVTIANRGQTNTQLFPDIQKVPFDRMGDVPTEIASKSWDFVIDFSCYYPSSLEKIVAAFEHKPSTYVYISTCSVYDNNLHSLPFRDESAPTLTCSEQEKIDTTTSSYGNRKAECERILKRSGIEYTILRPALVVGPYDNTDRFYYWLYQIKQNNRLLLPNGGKNSFSITYVSDVVRSILASITSQNMRGTFNVISEPKTSIQSIVQEAQTWLNTSCESIHVEASFLISRGIKEWTDLPLWLNHDYFIFSNERLIHTTGFESTPLAEIISKTIEYYAQHHWPKAQVGISDQFKNELIQQYQKEDHF